MTIPDPIRTNDLGDDADPMIDALLSEFIPREMERRLTPPDLTASILAKLASDDSVESEELAVEHNEDKDFDPVIDTLLSEFLPRREVDQLPPPDLTATIIARLETERAPASDEDADPVVDGLLPEVVSSRINRHKGPPDLSERIFSVFPIGNRSVRPAGQAAEPIDVPSWSRTIAVAVAVAACFFGVVWFGKFVSNDNGTAVAERSNAPLEDVAQAEPSSDQRIETLIPDRSNTLSGENRLATNDTVTEDSQHDTVEVPDPELKITVEPPMLADSSQGRSAQGRSAQGDSAQYAPQGGELTDVERLGPAPPISTVAQQTAQTAQAYWSSLGIQPTPDAPADQVAARIKDRLGVSLTESDLSAPERLHAALTSEQNAREIAKRWLAISTGSNLALLERPENQPLVEGLSKTVVDGGGMDVALVSLIDGSSPHSPQWYAAIGRGGTEGIAKRLAGISMNADLRCVKCHDSRVGRFGTQSDYWSFVSLVRSVVHRADKKWSVADESKPVRTFYELPDGRQKIAEPKVSSSLLKSNSEIEDFDAWADSLVGSKALASSLVDSLWRLVHGRPLKPSPVDAFAPPYDESLDQLHDVLA